MSTGTSQDDREIETARLAAAHYGRPEKDIPALVAFERHRSEQSKVLGMPELSGAIPNFIAGFHAGQNAASALISEPSGTPFAYMCAALGWEEYLIGPVGDQTKVWIHVSGVVVYHQGVEE